jgi:peptidoglycan hydrolase-like protein with peptidoglycan-binding domain
MKTTLTSFHKLIILTLVGTLAFSTLLAPYTAKAALTAEGKQILEDLYEKQTESSDATAAVYDIITYVFSLFKKVDSSTATPAPVAPVPTPNALPTERFNASICSYVKQVSSNLKSGDNNAQVKSLQQALNLLTKQDTRYTQVTSSGEGSYGNETTYFGGATKEAVSRWQSFNMGDIAHTKGIVDTATKARLQIVYCGIALTNPSNSYTRETNVVTNVTNNNSETSKLTKPTFSVSDTQLNKGDILTYTYDTGGHPGCKFYEPNLDGTIHEGGGWYAHAVSGIQTTTLWNDTLSVGFKCSDGAKADNTYTITTKASTNLSQDFTSNEGVSVSVDDETVRAGDSVTVSYNPGDKKCGQLFIAEHNPYKIIYNYAGFNSAPLKKGTYTFTANRTADIEMKCEGNIMVKTRVVVQ